MSNRIGQQFGSYRLIRLLGKGGFAEVYLGQHGNKLAAIKVLDASITDEEEKQNFIQEAKTLASLHHEHIVQVIDFGVQNGTPYLVMELAEKNIHTLPLPLPTVASYVKQIASALQYVHDHKKLAHRDVKPANILLRQNGEIILSDFGIAIHSRTTAPPTQEHILGTFPYMAPEQAMGKAVYASDQYSLGIMTYEWLTGRLPFEGSSDAILQQHKSAPPPPLRRKDTNARIPLRIEGVVRKALEKEPKRRYARIQDFANALDEAIQGNIPREGSFVVSSRGQAGAPDDPTERSLPPTLPPSPKLPVHALIQRQYEIIQDFQDITNDCDHKKQEQQQQYHEKTTAALQDMQRALVAAQQEERQTLQRAGGLHVRTQANGWDPVLRGSSNLLHALNASAPLQIALSHEYTRQMAKYRSMLNKECETLDVFLNYGKPQKLFSIWGVAGGIAFLLSFILKSTNFAVWLSILGVVLLLLLCLQLFLLTKAHVRVQQIEGQARSTSQQKIIDIQSAHEQLEKRLHKEHEDSVWHIDKQRQQQLKRPQSNFSILMEELGYAATDWSNIPAWEQWKPSQHIPAPVARIGTFDATADRPAMPTLVPYDRNIIFEAEGAAKDQAVATVQALILRLLATQPPSKVHFTFIDPATLGGNVKDFLSPQDSRNVLGISKAWYNDQQIKEQLHNLTEHIAQVRNGDGTDEMFHFLVVMDFPAMFTPQAADDLLRIARNGPQCGVSTIVVVDTERFPHPLPPTFDLALLEKDATVLHCDGQHFIWQAPDDDQLQLDTLPSPDAKPLQARFKHIVHEVGQVTQMSISIEQNREFNAALAQRGSRASTGKSVAWLGYSVATKRPISVTFEHRGDSNLLIVGKRDQVALELFVTTMVSLAAQYSPAQAHFYVVDLNTTDVGDSLLERASQSFSSYFRAAGNVRSVVKLRGLRDDLPRLLTFIIDELVDRREGKKADYSLYLFLYGLQFAEDMLASRNMPLASTTQALATLLKQGSHMGIHTLVWCDRPSSLETILGANALDRFDHRVVFPRIFSEEELTKLLREAPPSRTSNLDQAFLFSHNEQDVALFQPYSIPSKEWLQSLATRIQS